jgi:hypothetical protein
LTELVEACDAGAGHPTEQRNDVVTNEVARALLPLAIEQFEIALRGAILADEADGQQLRVAELGVEENSQHGVSILCWPKACLRLRRRAGVALAQ